MRQRVDFQTLVRTKIVPIFFIISIDKQMIIKN